MKSPVNPGIPPEALSAGDLDGDGDADLAVVADRELTLFTNQGAGTFHAATSVPTGGIGRDVLRGT